MTATVSAEQAMTIQCRTAHPLKAFQRMLGLMAAASPLLQLGLLLMRPIQFWLKHRVPSAAWRNGDSGPCISPGPVIPAAENSPVADPLEMGPPLSSEWHNMASTARVMGPACVAARRETFVHPECVLNTMAEGRAPSTRRLYALKWEIFSTWCQDRDLDPVTSDVSVVLSFQTVFLIHHQSLRGSHCSFPCPYCWPIGGQR